MSEVIDMGASDMLVISREYRVVDDLGNSKLVNTVRIRVDFNLLRSLARRAVENNSGEAVLHYGAIKAKVQP